MSIKYVIITFKNPLGVMTLGCTCELHAPSHLFTAISPLHVLWSRPSSSNSSKFNIELLDNNATQLKAVWKNLPLMIWSSEGKVSHSSGWSSASTVCTRKTAMEMINNWVVFIIANKKKSLLKFNKR